MDLASGYWQVAMSPEAKRKAAFVTNEGFTVVFNNGPGERILASRHVPRSKKEGRFRNKRGIIPIPGHAIRTVQCPSYVRMTHGPCVVRNELVPLSCVFR